MNAFARRAARPAYRDLDPPPPEAAALPRTLFDKVWESHVVEPEGPDRPALLYIDLHLVHEVTSPQAFAELDARGLAVRRPERTVATMDHSTPTLPPGADGERPYATPEARAQVAMLARNCGRHGVELHDWDSPSRGVVHVLGPELGLTQPGMTVVCGDSHTSTHGAFGALAFGIGTSEVGHVLATQCLLQRRPKTLRVRVDGRMPAGVSSKDLALAVTARLGIGGGTGHVIEYAGEAVRALGMEGRMTLCNMSIEAGARAGMVAPDGTTLAWLRGRPRAPQGEAFDRAAERWLALASDEDAAFDREVALDAWTLRPMATWGSTPDQAVAIDAPIPQPAAAAERRALDYMRFTAGRPVAGEAVDVVFVGSCTNGRLSDLRAAAAVLRGRKVAPGVRMLVAPGSEAVRREAEAEGLDEIFLRAGAEWRLPGCSMCIAMNGDTVGPGQLAVSTSNRNFEGRQGPGARTVLASPATAAASAVAGAVADPRPYLGSDSLSVEPIRKLTSRTYVLPQENIDTDQIIPARFLTTTERAGLGVHAFHDWRYDADGRPRDAELNRLDSSAHRILVAGRNFGCGSSREHAPWALHDFGFRAVVSTEIADIFTSNALKNGLLPVVVDAETHARLLEGAGEEATVDLEAQELRFGNHVASFRVEAFARRCLLDGVDPLGFILGRGNAISAFEHGRAA